MSGIIPTEQTELDFWYTRLTDIRCELERREFDIKLSKKLAAYWDTDIPSFIRPDRKYAVFTRSIFTPNHEMAYFLDLCHLLKLEPLLLEYTDGKFVAKNTEKYRLAKLRFYDGIGRNYGLKCVNTTLLNFNTQEGKRMYELESLWGTRIVDLHHEALFKVFPETKDCIVDFSEWFNTTRNKSGFYYFAFLALFLKNCVLFENFIDSDNEESKFTKKFFLPSFEKVAKYFDVKPMIYPLLPLEHEKSDWWVSYGVDAKNAFSGIIKRINAV